MAAGYTVNTNGAIALSAATAKTICAILNASTGLIRLVEMGVSFDGASGTAVPVAVELGYCTTAGAGTATTHTIQQIRGATRTAQATAKRNFTAEPTAITIAKEWYVHPQSGMVLQFPLGREKEEVTASYLIVMRVTAPATVNVRGYLEWEEG
jgi:hypothetical protein